LTKLPKTLDYGAFSSYAPIFDSRFSNLSKDETDLILNTYGDETGSQYADSIMKFSKDSLYASTLATRLLDLLTCGEHSKTMEVLTENERQKTVQKEVDKALPDWNQESKRLQNVQVDFEKLRTLTDIGLDVGFMDEIERSMKGIKSEDDLQEQLNVNASLMEQLHQVQYERLSAPLPHHLSHVPQPDRNEVEIAHQITSNFTEMAKKIPPSAVASIQGIRKAMGVSMPVFDHARKTSGDLLIFVTSFSIIK
jgi:bromodomain-containing protein 7/9